MKRFVIFLPLILSFHILIHTSAAWGQEQKNVLILNSYHQGFKWTDDITRGVISAMDQSGANSRIFIEYMGTKWVKDDLYFQELKQILKHKFSGTRFDLIVASDNDAFNFLRRNRDEVFGKIPVVFCGVNFFKKEDLAGTTLFTGVSETADLRESLELALTLHPQAKRIFVINDSAISGRIVHDELARLEPVFRHRAVFVYEKSTDLDTVIKDVESLPEDAIIFYTFFYGDPARKSYENDDCITRISLRAKVPIYGAWDFNLGHGIVGGKLTSGFDQGSEAGEMGLRILKGERIEDIPPILRSKTRYMFDYKQLNRFGISKSSLPPGSVIINGPESFRKVSNRVILATFSGIALLILFSILLLYVNERRKQSEAELRKTHDELEITVAQRTRELSEVNERLRQDIVSRRSAEEGLQNANLELLREVEARKCAEEASSRSVSLLRATIESTDDGILVVDNNGVIVDWNQRFLELWRIPEETMSTRDDDRALAYVLEQLLNPDEFLDKVKQLYSSPEMESIDILRFKDGRTFERYSRPQHLNDAIVGRVWSFRDITERKRMEEEVMKAQKLESLGVLAGGIAHDFNNLLTGLMGNISLAKMFVDKEGKACKRLEEAEKACKLTKGLTGQLLTFAKGGSPVKKVESIARIIMESAGFVLRGSNVRCNFTLPEDLWHVKVDSGQMSQVMNNLIINADQAMADGGVIKVSAENITVSPDSALPLQPGDYVHIIICDQGIGIPEENLLKIFDPYFTTKKKGSGLGLASVYSIIMKHEGHIAVESMPGQGSTFHIYLPASEEGFNEEEGLSRSEDAATLTGRVIVVDDEEVVRRTAKDILEHLGYQVDICEEGAAAINLYREAMASGRPYRAVFMDLTIPGGMGGKVTMKKLLEIDPNAKGVVTSGYSNDPILAHYRDYGFCGVMVKPFNVEEVMEAMKSLSA